MEEGSEGRTKKVREPGNRRVKEGGKEVERNEGMEEYRRLERKGKKLKEATGIKAMIVGKYFLSFVCYPFSSWH